MTTVLGAGTPAPARPAPPPMPAPAAAVAPRVAVTPVAAVAPAAAAGPAGVRAHVRITAASDGRGGTALPLLSGEGPFAPRRTRSADPARARVTLVGAMSAPLGGDRLTVETRVEAGAALRLDSSAAMIALPGRVPGHAEYGVRLTVGEDAYAHWLPEPLISARGSDLRQHLVVDLAPTARLVLRDEQVLGRTGEEPGRLSTRLTVRVAGRPLLDQQLDYGPGAPGWDGGAVLGAGHRAVGQLLVVDPAFAERPAEPRMLGETAAVTPLAGQGLLVTAVAPDALQLRRLLDQSHIFTSW
ncbi:urease accessory protein UreD [Streptomyces iconiensis]|uniref:Urease accessory protein UreD n=1 Tax=Streptomyces iconiensis TaxID=1384038 RepID=A0ABT7AAP4_9ACTN|nr:urease accessory protein UreD [Streptomyces iconiensis]MDJ1138069.1 urease accessory protein UreD [Streptomyces iconiensis]